MNKSKPVRVIVHYPEDENHKEKLAKELALIHANMVVYLIESMECSNEEKLKLLDSIIEAEKNSTN